MAWHAIHDSVDESQSLSALSDFAERLYWRLLAKSDPWGRMRGETHKLKARCVPLVKRATEQRIEDALSELVAVGRVTRYSHEGAEYLEIVDHDKHQPSEFTRRRKASKYPNPDVSGSVRTPPDSSALEREVEEERTSAVQTEARGEGNSTGKSHFKAPNLRSVG